MTISARIHAALRDIHWSQRAAAWFLRVDERTMRRWAAGEYPMPESSLAWLERVAAFLRDNPPP